MSDDLKELLTLAAKACGQVVTWHGEYCWIYPDGVLWAPHLNDGDGARMEEAREINPEWHDKCVVATAYPVIDGVTGYIAEVVYYADHGGNRQAARRWASLRAAAQVGRSMP